VSESSRAPARPKHTLDLFSAASHQDCRQVQRGAANDEAWSEHTGLSRQPNTLICSGSETGATGLEPATSGVTGRSCCYRAERGMGGDLPRKQGFAPLSLRGFAGAGGGFP
jgi:hypothetical protein